MTRIVLDPPELVRVAGHASEAAEHYARQAAELDHPLLPEMPPHVAAIVAAGADRVAIKLRSLAMALDAEALQLRLRAAVASDDPWGFAFALWNRLLGMVGTSLFPHTPAAFAIAGQELRELVSSGATPQQLHAFFLGLQADQRMYLVGAYPELIGPTAGAPFAMRYEANRILIQRAIAKLEESRAGLVRRMEGLEGVPRRVLEGFVYEIDRRLDDWREWASDGRQILLFDPWGDGRVAEVHGVLDDAAHVAILVPGMGSDITNFDGISRNAHNVYREAELLSPQSVATIAWLGYDAPDGALAASRIDSALDGAESLDVFVDGVAVGGAKHVTAVGHSYGSLVTGVSLRHVQLDVDDAVFVGSPGVGVNDRDDLGTGFEVWAAKSEWDPVSYAPFHGEDPSAEGFGANRFETGSPGGLTQRHSSYFEERSRSLRNIALIVTDQDDLVETR